MSVDRGMGARGGRTRSCRWTVVGPALVAGVLLGAVAGCGGDDGQESAIDAEPPKGGEDQGAGIRCLSASLSPHSARPFERVPLDLSFQDSVPEMAVARVQHDSLEEAYFARVTRDDDGWSLHAPIHPSGKGGGPVALRIQGDEFSCPDSLVLRLDSLPDAPGTTDSVVAVLGELIELQARRLGHEPESLSARDPSGLPAALWGAAVAQTILQGREYAFSLRNVLEGTTAEGSRLQEHLPLVDALLAAAGVPDLMRRTRRRLESLAPPQFQHDFRAPSAAVSRRRLRWIPASTAGATGRPAGRRQAVCPQPIRVFFSSPQALSHYMRLAEYARSSLQSSAYQNTQDVLTASSFIPHPAVSAAGTIISLLVTSQAQSWEAMAHTLPSELLGAEVDLSVTDFEEDAEYAGSWDEYRVTARSKGWNPTALMMENLYTALEAVLGARGVTDMMTGAVRGGAIADGVMESAQSHLEGEARSAWFEGFGEESQICRVAPQYWGPIDLTGPLYSEHEYRGSIGDVSGAHRAYRPTEVGPGRVSVHADPSMFPPASNRLSSMVTRDVTVHPISVTLDPSAARIEAGESIRIVARVQRAVDESVEWRVTAGEITSVGFSEGDSGDPVARLTAPSDRRSFPVHVVARSTSRTGLRADPSAEPRVGDGVYGERREVILSPRSLCVETGESAVLRAEVVGAPNDVEWETTGGSLQPMEDGRARFSAPTDGQYGITASAASDASLSASSRARVGTCDCYFRATLAGAAGVEVSTFENVRALRGLGNFAVMGGGDFQDVNITIKPVGPGRKGSQPAEIMVMSGDEGFWDQVVPVRDGPPGTMVLDTLTDSRAVGSFHARMQLARAAVRGVGGAYPVYLSGEFRTFVIDAAPGAGNSGGECR